MSWTANLGRVFARRNPRLAILASTVSAYGDWFFMIAFRGLMIELGGIPALTIGTIAPYGAAIAATPIAGWVADRFERRNVLALADLVRGLAILVVAWLVATHRATALTVTVLISVGAVFGVMYRAARLSFMPTVAAAEDLLALNALDGAVTTSAVLLAPAIGGVVATSGLERQWFFAIDGISFVIAILLVLRIRVARIARPPAAMGEKESWRAAIRLLAANRRIRWTTALLLCSYIGGGASFLIIPLLSPSVAGGGDAAIGYVTAALGLGVVAGMLSSGRLGRNDARRISAIAIVMFGVSLAASVWCRGPAVLVMAALIGFFPSLADPLLFTALQQGVPEDLRGRFFSMVESSIIVMLMFGGGLFGITSHLAGIVVGGLVVAGTVTLGGMACLATALTLDRVGGSET